MTRTVTRIVTMLALAGVLAASIPAPAGAARKKRNTIAATVNGKPFRWSGRLVPISNDLSGLIVIGTKAVLPGKVARTIGFGCPIYLPNFAVPGVAPQCSGNYLETKTGRHVSIKSWLATSGEMQVTIESFDGTRVTGSFSGTVQPVGDNPNGPVTLEGSFSGKVQF
jgi:hypothetical protein